MGIVNIIPKQDDETVSFQVQTMELFSKDGKLYLVQETTILPHHTSLPLGSFAWRAMSSRERMDRQARRAFKRKRRGLASSSINQRFILMSRSVPRVALAKWGN